MERATLAHLVHVWVPIQRLALTCLRGMGAVHNETTRVRRPEQTKSTMAK